MLGLVLIHGQFACRRAEAVSGLPYDSHQLIHNGEVLSGKSLAEYGIEKGSVLELVPYEPFPQEAMPVGSPLLSSPEHELVSQWLPTDLFKSGAQLTETLQEFLGVGRRGCTGHEVHALLCSGFSCC